MVLTNNQNVLAIGAHPDDVELGCFGTILKLAKTNQVFVLVLTGAGTERQSETTQAFRDSGIKDLTVMSFKDGNLPFNNRSVAAVESYIEQHSIGAVLTQTRWDTHQDHRTVEKVVMAACRRTPTTILGYHSLSSTPDFPSNLIVNIDEQMQRKLQALRFHTSQLGKPYFDPDFLIQWHHEKAATAVGLRGVELFHIYQAFWQ